MADLLLLSAPGCQPMMNAVATLPNLGMANLAGSVRDRCEVRILDLVLRRRRISRTLRWALEETRPSMVGLGCMSFQYDDALRAAALVKDFDPRIKVILGGYHPSLSSREIAGADPRCVDFIVRGEGELTLRELVAGRPPAEIAGLSYRNRGGWVRNPDRPAVAELDRLAPPARELRLLDGMGVGNGSRVGRGFHILGEPAETVETSRGCTLDCNFCSITSFYPRRLRCFSIPRVIEDIARARARGARFLFFVDDNITLNTRRFIDLCRAIVKAGHNDLRYWVQATVADLRRHPEAVEEMAAAGFKMIFLGVENVAARNLSWFHKEGAANGSGAIIRSCREAGMVVIGGFVMGTPADTRGDLWSNYRFAAESGVDLPLFQIATPYPGTTMREELRRGGYLTNPDRYRYYNALLANVRTDHLTSAQLDRTLWQMYERFYLRLSYFRSSQVRRFFRRHFYRLASRYFPLALWYALLRLILPHRAVRRLTARNEVRF